MNIFKKLFDAFTNNKNENFDNDEETVPVDAVPSSPMPQYNLGIKAMVVTDSHGKLMYRDVDNVLDEYGVPDVVFLLGDNRAMDLEVLRDNGRLKNVQFYGIIGNHEAPNTLADYEVPNLHLNTVSINGCIVGGFSGSLRYKEDSTHVLWTQEECSELLSTMESCDILLTHTKPEFELPEVVTSHTGFIGLGDYIKRCKPKYNLHGHLHDLYDTHYDSTIIKCLYGVSMVNL